MQTVYCARKKNADTPGGVPADRASCRREGTMQTVAAWARKHPVLAYFTITFIISWGGVLVLGSPYGMPATSEQFGKVWLVVFLPYFFGPATAGLLLTAFVDGR